jgi:hypothetical protein
MKEMIEAAHNSWPGSMSYDEYRDLSIRFAEEGKTTGDDQSAAMVEYSRLNAHRMKRIEKTVQLKGETLEAMAKIAQDQTWILFTETWCGDAAQSLPILAKIAQLNPRVELKILLRDEHPELMQYALTKGGKSVPKLIAFDASMNILFSWGPRPIVAQEMVMDFKHAPEPKKPYTEFVVEVQKWYAKDKGQSIQQEFIDLLQTVPQG